MAGKFMQISVRVDQKILDKIEALIASGQFASKSDFVFQAIIASLNREDYEKQVRGKLIELLRSDGEVAGALKDRVREVIATSLGGAGGQRKVHTPTDHRVNLSGTDDL